MPFRLIFFSFAKCENKGEVAGHEHMTLTRRMAHAHIELHKKLKMLIQYDLPTKKTPNNIHECSA